MKRIGATLMALGGLVGLAAGVWVAIGIDQAELPWVVSVGLVKLIIVAGIGLMAAGAMLTRVAKRAEDAEHLRQLALKAANPPHRPCEPTLARRLIED
jgi:hypothetical protein